MQVGLIAVPLVLLPIAVPSGWLAPASGTPIGWVLLVLLIMVGAPFFALSTLSPTLQRWLADTDHPAAANPYFLYAAGNAGSLLSLLAYPLLLGADTGSRHPNRAVDGGLRLAGAARSRDRLRGPSQANPGSAIATPPPPPPWKTRLFWGYAAFVPSALMLGVTRHLATDVALVSPSVGSSPRPVSPHLRHRVPTRAGCRKSSVAAMAVRFSVIPVILTYGFAQDTWLLLAPPPHLFAAAALIAHGRLMVNRPEPSGLTEFYLWISIGGAAGGVFAALLAPVLFDQILEYPIAVALALTLLAGDNPRRPSDARLLAIGALGVALAAGVTRVVGQVDAALMLAAVATVIAYVMFRKIDHLPADPHRGHRRPTVGAEGTLATERTFFGVHRVFESGDDTHVISSGTTVHGVQKFGLDAPQPSGYYHPLRPDRAGAHRLQARPALDVAVTLGLGAGTLAAYSRPSDSFTFFEIDPAVVEVGHQPRTLHVHLARRRARSTSFWVMAGSWWTARRLCSTPS